MRRDLRALPPFEDDILSLDPPPRFPRDRDRIDPGSASATGYLGFLSLAARRDPTERRISRFRVFIIYFAMPPSRRHGFVADADTYNMYDAL